MADRAEGIKRLQALILKNVDAVRPVDPASPGAAAAQVAAAILLASRRAPFGQTPRGREPHSVGIVDPVDVHNLVLESQAQVAPRA